MPQTRKINRVEMRAFRNFFCVDASLIVVLMESIAKVSVAEQGIFQIPKNGHFVQLKIFF